LLTWTQDEATTDKMLRAASKEAGWLPESAEDRIPPSGEAN
jgi:hypothetical protein